jgi:PPIC-type PPIASE domain
MKKFLRDPLFHFLLIGAALFLAYRLTARPGNGSAPGKIVVTQAQIEHFVTAYATTFQRPPTDEELKGLVDDWVREEIAVREATALKLGQGDTVIRRRLRQKFEFVSEDIAKQVEPTDADLEAYLKAHPDKFASEPSSTFIQIYFNPDKHGKNLARDAAQLLARLQAGERVDPSRLGDVSLLQQSFIAIPASEVEKQFGASFAKAVTGLALGLWQGPIPSGYGVHLVKITERFEGQPPALSKVRDTVRRDWFDARRLEMSDELYRELLKSYTVTIEPVRRPATSKEVAAK